jgi:hypothetical protein
MKKYLSFIVLMATLLAFAGDLPTDFRIWNGTLYNVKQSQTWTSLPPENRNESGTNP